MTNKNIIRQCKTTEYRQASSSQRLEGGRQNTPVTLLVRKIRTLSQKLEYMSLSFHMVVQRSTWQTLYWKTFGNKLIVMDGTLAYYMKLSHFALIPMQPFRRAMMYLLGLLLFRRWSLPTRGGMFRCDVKTNQLTRYH